MASEEIYEFNNKLPSLKDKARYRSLPSGKRELSITTKQAIKHCCDNQRIIDTIYKVTKHEPNKLMIVTDFLKELGIE